MQVGMLYFMPSDCTTLPRDGKESPQPLKLIKLSRLDWSAPDTYVIVIFIPKTATNVYVFLTCESIAYFQDMGGLLQDVGNSSALVTEFPALD